MEEVRRWLAQHDRRLDNVEEDVSKVTDEMRAEFRDMRRLINRRFDTVDNDHQNAQKVNVKSLGATALAVAAAIGVPIATAFILAPK